MFINNKINRYKRQPGSNDYNIIPEFGNAVCVDAFKNGYKQQQNKWQHKPEIQPEEAGNEFIARIFERVNQKE